MKGFSIHLPHLSKANFIFEARLPVSLAHLLFYGRKSRHFCTVL